MPYFQLIKNNKFKEKRKFALFNQNQFFFIKFERDVKSHKSHIFH
jgi:hypothetical protein